MKKSLPILLASFLMGVGLSACSAPSLNNDKLEIVTTIFPEYDWTREILGKNPANAEVTMLLDNGIDLHSYQPTAQDLIKISDCDLFIYVGGESDEWVERALEQSTNKDMVVINLLESLGDKAKEEEVKEGMQGEEEHDHDHEDHDHDHEDEHEDEGEEYDEHIWLSPENAMFCCEQICDALCQADPAHTNTYRTHAAAYAKQLTALKEDYQQAVASSSVKTVVFADRFPFRYLTDACGLTYYAAFAGCSAETEASFETIVFLANKVDELGLKTILTTESTDGSVANTVRDNTRTKDQTILSLDSMQSVTAEQIRSGISYYEVMQKNLSVLRQALASPHPNT